MLSFRHNILPKTSALALLCLLLAGCMGLIHKDDPRPVEAIVGHAEQLVVRKAYKAAAEQYSIVVSKAPTNGAYYLRYAELLERVDEDKQARKVYKAGLEQIPADDPARPEIIYRLALIDANHLYKLDEAEDLLHELPGNSIERYDLAAFLYYQSGQYETALDLLNKALERVREADQKALLMYHASLIYHKLDDVKNTFGSLYHAINLSEHLGLVRDIENFWVEINKDQPLGATGLPRD